VVIGKLFPNIKAISKSAASNPSLGTRDDCWIDPTQIPKRRLGIAKQLSSPGRTPRFESEMDDIPRGDIRALVIELPHARHRISGYAPRSALPLQFG
jgi:hypothetical protein